MNEAGIRSGEEFALLWDQRSRDFIDRKVPRLEFSWEEEERMLRMLSEFGDWLKRVSRGGRELEVELLGYGPGRSGTLIDDVDGHFAQALVESSFRPNWPPVVKEDFQGAPHRNPSADLRQKCAKKQPRHLEKLREQVQKILG